LREKIMSGEKESLEKLVERIDELLVVLSRISEDLRSMSESIKSVAGSQVTQPAPQAAAPVSHEIHENKSVEDVRVAFPEDLEALLSFQEKDDYIMVKPRQFLGSENFAKIASAVRGMGGEYISAGKDSHFRVPKKA
jgi:dsDNA-specific endonuclease/ATPase MutS2